VAGHDSALILPSAGSGRRLALGIPKALVEIHGVPLLGHTLAAMSGAWHFVQRIVVVPPGERSRFSEALAASGVDLDGVLIVPGGDTRQASVAAGLEASDAELVCVHDAARPLVSQATVESVMRAALRYGAATAAARPSDSLREDHSQGVTRAVDRNRFWLVQTPQAFRRPLLVAAHTRATATGAQATDDASLVEATGVRIEVVASTGPNPKITRIEDLELARILLRPRERRR
jgi:2-C-methyl-D-erythritol 4-phosphate cytidylyltransferase